MSEETLQRGEWPSHHRTGNKRPFPGLDTATRDASLRARQTQSSWHTPGSDKGTTTPSAALTKASFLPSSTRPDWEKYNCHSTVPWLLYNLYKHTHKYTFIYTYMCTLCSYTRVYIHTHRERERERDSGQNRELKELMVKGFSQRLFQTQSVWLFLPLLPKPHPLQSGTTSFNSIIILTIWQSSWILPHSEWFYDPEDKAELECHFKYGWLSNLCFLSGLHDYPHTKHLNTDELWWDLCLALSAWAASPESVCFGSWLQGRFKTLASATTKL